MLTEMLQFLSDEFGNHIVSTSYAITISPLVGRMNCQRNIGGVTMDFVSLPDYVFSQDNVKQISDEEYALNLHMLFTEMDHAFVNPTTDKHKKLVSTCFNPEYWDKGSGYESHKLATFNEYMTWAVYDLFIYKYFPQAADTVCKEWAAINVNRGFHLSSVFNSKLKELYDKRESGERIADLYPELLQWCKEYGNATRE